jgi:hypothetical protein
VAANDGPLLLSAVNKKAGEMAVLNSEVVATRQTSVKLGGASNGATAGASRTPDRQQDLNNWCCTLKDWLSCCLFFVRQKRYTSLHD